MIISKIKSELQRRKTDTRDRGNIEKIQKHSLLFHSGNMHTQIGQDGILREIFSRIGIEKGRFVEFGAWDGIYLSNCRYLFELGWSGVFIEADQAKFLELSKNYMAFDDIICIHSIVEQTGSKSIDNLLHTHDIENIDLLCIDIDGLDLEILENMKIKPEVIMIEGGFSWSPYLCERVPTEISKNNLQQPLPVIFASAYKQGYVPVCFMQDTFLVKIEYQDKFREINTDPVVLYRDAYFFMGSKHRQSLLSLRQSNKDIYTVESQANVSYII